MANDDVTKRAGPDTGTLLRGFRNAVQIGVVVRDIEKSMRELTALFGIGPFRVIDCPPAGREDRQFKDGRLIRFHTRQAFADMGSVELELIQPIEGPTIWADFMATHGPGIHHIRFNTENLEEVIGALDKVGVAITQEGAGIREGTRWVNFDTEDRVGFTVEVMKPAPGSDGRTPRSSAEDGKKRPS
jgi:methylmalonyl-CoA/ethylmalonyl-CoA epimerase